METPRPMAPMDLSVLVTAAQQNTEILGRQVHRTALSALKRTWKKCHKNLTHLIHLDSSWFILIHFDWFLFNNCVPQRCVLYGTLLVHTCTLYLCPFSWRCFPLLVQIPLRKSENSLAFANAATVTSNPTCLEHGSNTSEWSRRRQIPRGGQHESVMVTPTKGLCRLYPNKFT